MARQRVTQRILIAEIGLIAGQIDRSFSARDLDVLTTDLISQRESPTQANWTLRPRMKDAAMSRRWTTVQRAAELAQEQFDLDKTSSPHDWPAPRRSDRRG
jgi:hypothetical protein